MLIPSIDLKGGQVVQLIQGERTALASKNIDVWVKKFQGFPKVQLIDLDAAMNSGTNDALVQYITPRITCRVGGGIRTINRASEVINYGASAVIVGSALFNENGINENFAKDLAEEIGRKHIIVAVDSKGGQIAIQGWKETVALTAVDAVAVLEPYCTEFLYTHVDREGLMQGTDMESIMAVREATTNRLTAAGGITTQEEISRLDAAGIDAVVGMAIYTGKLPITAPTKD